MFGLSVVSIKHWQEAENGGHVGRAYLSNLPYLTM